MADHNFIYLASQSPRRASLLEQIQVRYEILSPAPDIDYEQLEAMADVESSEEYVARVTKQKIIVAEKNVVDRGLQPAPILCADTTVECEGHILGKPHTPEEAKRMLSMLSGNTHLVLTAVSISWQGQRKIAISKSEVLFDELTAEAIQAYIASGEPFGKAGAYGIQGYAARWVKQIVGSYSGIMGLPLFETTQLLQATDVF